MSTYLTGMLIYSTDVDILNKLFHLDVDITNTNETEDMLTYLTGMSIYFMHVDIRIPNKFQIYKTTIQRQVMTLPINDEIK